MHGGRGYGWEGYRGSSHDVGHSSDGGGGGWRGGKSSHSNSSHGGGYSASSRGRYSKWEKETGSVTSDSQLWYLSGGGGGGSSSGAGGGGSSGVGAAASDMYSSGNRGDERSYRYSREGGAYSRSNSYRGSSPEQKQMRTEYSPATSAHRSHESGYRDVNDYGGDMESKRMSRGCSGDHESFYREEREHDLSNDYQYTKPVDSLSVTPCQSSTQVSLREMFMAGTISSQEYMGRLKKKRLWRLVHDRKREKRRIYKNKKKNKVTIEQESDSRAVNDESASAKKSSSNPHTKLECPHCHVRCMTFKQYNVHLHTSKHMAAMTALTLQLRHKTLPRIQAEQRDEQRIIDDECKEKNMNMSTFFCTICKLSYRCPKAEHQASVRHKACQELRDFLSPYCHVCHMSFKSPMFHETHICQLDHIHRKINLEKRLAEKEAELKDVDIESVVGKSEEEKEEQEKIDGGKEAKKKKKSEVKLGAEYCKKLEVYYCDLCRFYLPSRLGDIERSLVLHCSSQNHLYKCVQYRDDQALCKPPERLHRLREEEEKLKKAKEEDEEKGNEDGDKTKDGSPSKVKPDSQMEDADGAEHCRKVEVYYCDLCRIYIPHQGEIEHSLVLHCSSENHLYIYVRYCEDQAMHKQVERLHCLLEEEKKLKKYKEESKKVKEEDEEQGNEGGDETKDSSQSKVKPDSQMEDADGMDEKMWSEVYKDIDLLREVEPGNKSSDEDDDSRAEDGGHYD